MGWQICWPIILDTVQVSWQRYAGLPVLPEDWQYQHGLSELPVALLCSLLNFAPDWTSVKPQRHKVMSGCNFWHKERRSYNENVQFQLYIMCSIHVVSMLLSSFVFIASHITIKSFHHSYYKSHIFLVPPQLLSKFKKLGKWLSSNDSCS